MAARWCFLLVTAPVVNAQLRILAPESLAREWEETSKTIYGTTATFGAPYYDKRLLGRLLYGESHGREHCADDDYNIQPPDEDGPAEGGKKLVNVVLVRRGNCTFVTKVRVAEGKGADAVVVVDRATSTLTAEEIQHVMMADDGSGYDVKIPSIMISRYDGQKLIDVLKKRPVMVEMAWDIPRGQVVVADFWMSSGFRESREFLQRFKDCAQVLKHHLQFVPHYHLFSLESSAANGKLCTDMTSRYCALDPDGPGPVTGSDVANEDLRQLCIWNVTARMPPTSTKGATYSKEFWDYVVRFAEQCPIQEGSPATRFSPQCSEEVMQEVNIDKSQVDSCIQLHREKFLDDQIKNTAWSTQALRVNGWRYQGPLDPQAVLKAVCSGYATPLQECEVLLAGGIASRAGLTFSIFAWTSIAMAFCLVFLFYLYRNYVTSSVRKVLREEVTLEVQTQMADYAQLSDGPEKQGHRPSLSF